MLKQIHVLWYGRSDDAATVVGPFSDAEAAEDWMRDVRNNPERDRDWQVIGVEPGAYRVEFVTPEVMS